MSANILLVIEGERLEHNFFSHYLKKFNVNAHLCVVGANIHMLYSKCKSYGFDCDVKDILKEMVRDDVKSSLEQKFAYTYLVFDADLHHKNIEQRGKTIDIETIIDGNFPQLIEMVKHFTDETDPSIGKLYINYPMMESFRYCNRFNDDAFLSATIPIESISDFKQLASKMALSGRVIENYTRDNFVDLIRMNVLRLESLLNKDIRRFLSYDEYIEASDAVKIADNQHERMLNDKEIHVLNSSIFLILDYFGNKDKFYENLIENNDRQLQVSP